MGIHLTPPLVCEWDAATSCRCRWVVGKGGGAVALGGSLTPTLDKAHFKTNILFADTKSPARSL
jgi:hypothetical protein